MRCEKPWSVSVGTYQKISASAAQTSVPAVAASTGTGLLRNHIFKGSPANDGNDRGGSQEREHGDALRRPDRAPVARREHEPVEQVLLALGHEGTRQAEDGREEERDPQQAFGRQVRAVRGQGEVEDDKGRDDEE